MECECCGSGVVEIKCPYTIKDDIPPASNLDYLDRVVSDGKEVTKFKTKKSAYFFQIQGQMVVTGRSYCDLFIQRKDT